MEGLIEQLKSDLIELFSSDESEYKDILIKEKYELYPEIQYPAITINELENEDVNRYFDETERVTGLAYQFTIHSEQTIDKTAIQNVRRIANIIDTYFKGEKYRCLRRVGSLVIAPMKNDDNVMLGYLRYECYLMKDTNTIYRR